MSRIISVIAALAVLLGLSMTTGTPSAGAVGSAASATRSVTAVAGPVGTSWADCRSSAARGSNPYMKVALALANPRCGWTVISAAGTANANTICWTSRQWWGAPARWVVWMVTWGQYSTC